MSLDLVLLRQEQSYPRHHSRAHGRYLFVHALSSELSILPYVLAKTKRSDRKIAFDDNLALGLPRYQALSVHG